MEKETVTIDKREYDQLIETEKQYKNMINREIFRLQQEQKKLESQLLIQKINEQLRSFKCPQ